MIHHTAGGAGSDSLAYAKSVARMHWNQLGSSGRPWRRPGGYQEQIGLDGVSREMSGLLYRGIHSGSYEANRDYIAISFQGNYSSYLPNDDMLTAAAYRVAQITDELDWHNGAPLLKGHRDLYPSTTCPGSSFYVSLPGSVTRYPDDPPEFVWPQLLRRGDSDPAVAIMKSLLLTLDYGNVSETYSRYWEGKVKQFQGDMGLVKDGIVGPHTHEALTSEILKVLP